MSGTSDLREQIFALLYSLNRPEDAILQLNRVIKKSPENSQALALKAYALNKLANVRKEWEYSKHALDYADRALALNPDDDIALTSKGWALMDLGKPNEALVELNHAVRVNPSNEYAWYNLAWAQYLTGNALASAESIERALGISPGNAIIKRGKEMMEKGELPKHLRTKSDYQKQKADK
jgi:tetratricopeptide (TPR) repeat protein